MILEILNEIGATASRNEKLAILACQKDNGLLQQVVKLALDPYIQFYQRKIPSVKDHTNLALNSLRMYEFCSRLSSRAVTGKAAINELKNELASLCAADAEVLSRIIQKDLKCGAHTSTINSVWPGLIPTYPVMLCSQMEQKLIDKFKFPCIGQLKLDGMRFNAIVEAGIVTLRSRTGRLIELNGNLEEAFLDMTWGRNAVFDGELLVRNPSTGKYLDRKTGNGILNKAVKGKISAAEAANVCAVVWDYIPLNDFKAEVCLLPYDDRLSLLHNRITNAKSDEAKAKIALVPSYPINNLSEAQILFKKQLADGEEGLILKDPAGIWENKRTKSQIKMKAEQECDLKIIGWTEGEGQAAGSLGSFLCASSDDLLKTSVGTGFTPKQRADFWAMGFEAVCNKIAAIKYNMRIETKTGEKSLFLPVFVEIREDKLVADSDEDIK